MVDIVKIRLSSPCLYIIYVIYITISYHQDSPFNFGNTEKKNGKMGNHSFKINDQSDL